MDVAGAKKWWPTVAMAAAGGIGVGGLWFGIVQPLTAEPAPPVARGKDANVWVRPEAPTPFKVPADANVVPASGTVPVPAVPAPAVPPAPLAAPPQIALPSPTAPALPPAVLPAVNAPPLTPPAPPVAPAAFPPIPAADAAKPPANVVPPAVPELPAPTPLPPVVPPLPSPTPTAPPAPDLTPPPPSVKVPEPLPVVLPKPDSGLPPVPGGISVKPESGGGTLPIVPPTPAAPLLGKPGDAPGTLTNLAKPAEVPLPKPEQFPPPLPAAPTNPLVPTPGDSTMTLNPTAAAAVIGGVLLAPTPPAQAFPPLPTSIVAPMTQVGSDTNVDAAALKTQLKETNKKLDDIQKQLDDLLTSLNGRKDKEGYRVEGTGLLDQVKELKNRLEEIEKKLDKKTTSLSPPTPTPNAVVDPRSNKGTVRVVNEYPVQISIVVNGTSYKVAPSKTLDVDVTAGPFSYQLLESGAVPTNSVIKEKETVTLRIK